MNARSHVIRIGTGLAVLLLLSQAVVAQTVSVDSSKTKTSIEAMRPEIDTQEVTLAFSYTPPQQAYNLAGAGQSTATASIDVSCADATNILVTGPKTAVFNLDPANAQNTAYPYQQKYQIAVTRDLPGLKQIRCEYESKVGAVTVGTNVIPESNTDGGAFLVSAKFYSVVQAKVAQQIKEAGPQKEVPFEIQLDNFGNARTQIAFTVEEKPGGKKWQAVVPDDVILDSPASGGAKTADTAVFTVQTPYKNGWNNEQGIYRVKMKTFAADDPEQTGIELGTNMLVRVRGVYVPSLEPMVMVGAVLGSALIARMVRRE